MQELKRKYYSLTEAAKLFECSTADLLHQAIHFNLSIYTLPRYVELTPVHIQKIYPTEDEEKELRAAYRELVVKQGKRKVSDDGFFEYIEIQEDDETYEIQVEDEYIEQLEQYEEQPIFDMLEEQFLIPYHGLVRLTFNDIKQFEFTTNNSPIMLYEFDADICSIIKAYDEPVIITDWESELFIMTKDIERLSISAEKIEQQRNDDNKKESPQKIENLLKALCAVAIDAYGYKPESKKSTAPKDIENAILIAFGGGVQAEAIRGWLQEGAKHIPPEKKNK